MVVAFGWDGAKDAPPQHLALGKYRTMKYLIVLILFLPSLCLAQPKDMAEFQKMMAEVQKSHIEGNVPDQVDFGLFLQRDLEEYFNPSGNNVTLKYQLLRDGPTQSGVSYPKYYVWVQVFEGTNIIKEGAARVAAIEKKRFEVFDFLSKSSLQENPGSAAQVFPAPLLAKINQLAGL